MHRFIYIALLILSLSLTNAWSQTTDFFTNTQGIDRLSTGSGGSCPTCPGFNPDFLIRHAGTDPDGAGPISFSQSISTTAPSLGGTPTVFFNQLGPGAVTDNLFGAISDPGTDPAKCGTTAGLTGLNCGDLRFDPTSQGMTIPTTPAADVLTSHVFSPSTFTGDFFPSTNDHTGIDLKNRFIWSRTTATLTDVDLSVTCTTGTFTCVGSKQREHQVTALVSGASGTLAAPGSGEQDFDQTVDWNITNSSGSTFSAPTITWTLQFNDPIRDDNGNARLQSSLMSGSFTYNGDPIFPSVTIPLVRNASGLCRGVAGTAGTCLSIP
ncbi:MAG: hypothetical protein ACE5GK_08865 [Nitrospiria bacterium]